MTHVVLSDLTKTYQGSQKPALDRLVLEIKSGELVALLGPSGCGKTTALKLIAGLLHATSGDVQFNGRSIVNDKPEARGAVMVFQNHLLFPFMSVADNIGFGLKMRGVDKRDTAARVVDMLEKVRLPGLGARLPSELSGGQLQRVALARALVVEPRILLLDEPLSNLDAHLRVEMRDLIRTLQQNMGITTLLVTHDQEEAVAMADRVALLLDGRLRQHAEPDIFYNRPADMEVARFFGGRNFIQGESDGQHFFSPLGRLQLPPQARQGQGVLTFRPESVNIGSSSENTLVATLTEKKFLGTHTRLKLSIGKCSIEAVVSPDRAVGLNINDSAAINLAPQSLWIMPKQAD